MWRLNPHHGAVLEPEEYVDSVRLRMGCAGPCVNLCPVLLASLDPWIRVPSTPPAALWAKPRGHNAVTAFVHAAQSCDGTAETEVPGLIPGTDLRPADVLTSALGNSSPPSTSRSALRMPSRPGPTAHRPGTKPNSPTTAHTAPLFSASTFSTHRSSGAPMGDLTETR